MKKKVLLVDDDEGILGVFSSTLEMAGYRVLPIANGKEVLRCVRDHQPDIIVLDYMLPDTDGLEVAKKLRASSKMAKIPILMTSAHVRPADFNESLPVDIFMEKPIDMDDFLFHIKKLLDPKRRSS